MSVDVKERELAALEALSSAIDMLLPWAKKAIADQDSAIGRRALKRAYDAIDGARSLVDSDIRWPRK